MRLLAKVSSLEKRIQKAPAVADSDIRAWAKARLKYNELTEEQRTRYNEYWEIDFEDFYNFIGAPLDFELELKPPPPKSRAEEVKRIEEAANKIKIMLEEKENYDKDESS